MNHADRNAQARANAQHDRPVPMPIPWDDFLASLQPWRSMSDADLATLREFSERELGEWSARVEGWLVSHYTALVEGCSREGQRRAALARARSITSPRFDSDFVQRIKDAVCLWEYAAFRGLKVRRSGNERYLAPCPFHADRTPSFSIWNEHAKCFGCGWAGDLFTFIEDQTGDRNFLHAVEEAARYAGISMPLPVRVLPRVIDG